MKEYLFSDKGSITLLSEKCNLTDLKNPMISPSIVLQRMSEYKKHTQSICYTKDSSVIVFL